MFLRSKDDEYQKEFEIAIPIPLTAKADGLHLLSFEKIVEDFAVNLAPSPITVNVDGLRFPCYQKILEKFAANLAEVLTKFDCLGDRSGPLNQIVKDCARVLDTQLIKCMDNDLKSYRKDKKIDHKLLSISEARKAYEDYIKSRSGDLTYSEYMQKEYPYLFDLFQEVTKNYLHNTEEMLKRITKDMDDLKKSLLSELKGNIYLSKITPTGSDYHFQGNQVFILEFKDEASKAVKVVYKPTSLNADAMIVGDLQKLAKIDPRFVDQQSMVEKFNHYLAPNGENKLPTYFILPKKDEAFQPEDMRGFYGYSQFLPHERFFSIDYDDILEEALKKMPPANRKVYVDQDLPTAITNYVQTALQEAADYKSDYITDDEEVIKEYSRQCGLLVALMISVGLVDQHYGNLIVHKLQPYLLDCESCLVPAELDLRRLLFSDLLAGSMSRNSMNREYDAGLCLFDIAGLYAAPASHPEKNLIFSKDESTIKARQPREAEFKKGYELGIKIIRGIGVNWLDQPEVQNMPVRLIAYPTDHFVNELNELIKCGFSPKSFEEMRKGNYQKSLMIYQSSKSPFELPMGCVYQENNKLLEEYKKLSIPFFYAIANSKTLRDCNGEPVPLSDDFLASRPDVNHKDFFIKSPLDFIKERIQYIIKDENYENLINLMNSDKRFFELGNMDVSLTATMPRRSPTLEEDNSDKTFKSQQLSCLIS